MTPQSGRRHATIRTVHDDRPRAHRPRSLRAPAFRVERTDREPPHQTGASRVDPARNPPAGIDELRHLPDGTLYRLERGDRRILVCKSGAEIQLLFDSDESCEIQSRLDLDHPLDLKSPYTRAAMLFLLWKDVPRRAHVVGLGGGRIPMVLGHHYPEALIDCTEIEPDVTSLAVRFFGFRPGASLRVFHEDAREFMERRGEDELYDVIVVDAFSGLGFGPPRLATTEFFHTCRRQLASDGILVLSILPGDPLLDRKVATVAAAFQHADLYQEEDAVVVFGHDGAAAGRDQLIRRAHELQARHGFAFSLPAVARSLWPVPRLRAAGGEQAAPAPLCDRDLGRLGVLPGAPPQPAQ